MTSYTSNGTHNSTPPEATTANTYTEDEINRLTELGVVLTWEDLDAENRLDCCLANPHVDEWLDTKALETFADFRLIPTQWAKIKAGYRRLGGDVRNLDEAVQGVRTARPAPERPHAIRISARDLKAKVLPPLNFVVAELLPAGCTLLTAKSKEGKSMLAYNLGVSVASGGLALGKYATMAGSVWYLALEDGERRAQQRLALQEAQMGPLPEEAQDRLTFTFWEAPRLGAGLEEEIRAWIETTPDARLIIIDILEKVRPPRHHTGSVYEDDYAATSSLTRLAEAHNVAILILHHSNKSNPADFRDSASGAMSLIGGADNFWALSRQPMSEEATLKVTGRDLPREYDLALQFKDGYWTALGEARYVKMSDERQALVDVLKDSPRPLTPKQIALATGKNYTTTKMLLAKMLAATVVLQPLEGHYTLSPSYLATTVDPVDRVDSVDPIDSVDSPRQPLEPQEVSSDSAVDDPGDMSTAVPEPVYGGSTGVYGESTAEHMMQPLEDTWLNTDTVYGSTESMGSTPASDCHGGNPPPAGSPPCVFCHGTTFWTGAAGQALCCRCHPQPTQRQEG